MVELASFTAIFTGGMLAGFLIYAYHHEEKFILWEDKHVIAPLRRLWQRIKRFIRKCLKKNEYFMKWLNKPVKHGKPDAEFIEGQIKVFCDVWRL